MKINTNKIVTLLAEKNLTKAALAEKSGISRQNLCTILGRGTCEPRTAGKLARGFGVQLEEIVKEE